MFLIGLYGASLAVTLSGTILARRPGRDRPGAPPPEDKPEPRPSDPADERWDVFHDKSIVGDLTTGRTETEPGRANGPSDRTAPPMRPSSPGVTTRPPGPPPPERPTTDDLVAVVRTEIQASSKGILNELRNLREQQAGALLDARAKLAEEQKRLVDRQREMLNDVVAPILAERDATVRQIRDENQQFREHVAAFIQEAMSKLAQEQQRLQQALVSHQSELLNQATQSLKDELITAVVDRVTSLDDEQQRFRRRLIAASRAAESQFVEFRDGLYARLEKLNPRRASDVAATAVAALSEKQTDHLADVLQRLSDEHSRTLAEARNSVDDRMEELAGAVNGTIDQQQQLEATLGEIQTQVRKLARQRVSRRIHLDDEQVGALREALQTPPKRTRRGKQAITAKASQPPKARGSKRTRPPRS